MSFFQLEILKNGMFLVGSDNTGDIPSCLLLCEAFILGASDWLLIFD